MPTQHIFDFLESPPATISASLCAIFGGERYLKKLAAKSLESTLLGDDAEFGSFQFEGDSTSWADVIDELSTLQLFASSGPRIAVVDQADAFVKKHRDRLEDYVKSAPDNALLVLIVGNWAANTRLYKLLDKSGFQINCDAPRSGKSKRRDDSKIVKWLVQRAKQIHQFQLSNDGAKLLIELTECEFGRMDQELCKLALYADEKGAIDEQQIPSIIGGWPMQTMWQAIDEALEGNAGSALKLIQQLIESGQHPLAMFGQITWALRRYAETGEIVARQQRQRNKVELNAALLEAGFRDNRWNSEIESATRRLRQLGRDRVYSIYHWILEAELALKRTHSKSDRGQLALEKLVVRLAKELGPMAV